MAPAKPRSRMTLAEQIADLEDPAPKGMSLFFVPFICEGVCFSNTACRLRPRGSGSWRRPG